MPGTNEISTDSIIKLRKYCYTEAENSEDSSFELAHMKQVEENILMLAKKRDLEYETACLIALLHDMGRIIGGIYGKGHAKESARIAGPILRKYKIPEEKREIIQRAISVHNKKKRIHDVYSELIKDADSMTRFSGLSEQGEETHEYIRNHYALTGKCTITHEPDCNVPKILGGLCLDIDDEIKTLKKGKIRGADIHRIRVKIRQARSIIWYLKQFYSKKRQVLLNIIDDGLKSVFRDYEYPRKLYVLVKFIKKLDISKKYVSYIAAKRNEAAKQLLKKSKSKHKKIIEDINHRIGSALPMKMKVKYKSLNELEKIGGIIRNADVTDMKSVHELRLLCKKLIYLHDMGIIDFSQPDMIILLKKLHKGIGSVNDSAENKKLLIKIIRKHFGLTNWNDVNEKIDSFYDISLSQDSIAMNIFKLNVRLIV